MCVGTNLDIVSLFQGLVRLDDVPREDLESAAVLFRLQNWVSLMSAHNRAPNRIGLNSIMTFLFPSQSSAMSNHDPWKGLATLMTLLETIVDTNKDYLSLNRGKGG